MIVAASAPHRPAAFLGARALIDEIKAQLPDLEARGGRLGTGRGPGAARTAAKVGVEEGQAEKECCGEPRQAVPGPGALAPGNGLNR